MAIISSYPIQGTPSLSDYVIGTDAVNSNATVNFLLSDIIGLANLPTTYVPYSGATADVNLGSHNLNMNSGYITFPSNTGIVMPGGASSIGLVGQLNSITSNTNNCIINSYIDIVNTSTEIRLGGNAGLAGQVLISNGSNVRPSWLTLSSLYVPYTGATSDVDLGSRNISANTIVATNTLSLFGANTQLFLNSSAGTAGQILQTNGAGLTPSWVTLPRGQFYNTTATISFTANTMAALAIPTTDALTSGISVVTNGTDLTRITFSKTGVYRFSYTCSVVSGISGNSHTVRFWIRKNGTGTSTTGNISFTAQSYTAPSNAYGESVSSSILVDITAGDYIELMAIVSSNNITLQTVSPGVGYPAEPAVSIRVNQV